MQFRVLCERTAAGPAAVGMGVSERVIEVAGMFGLGLDTERQVTVVPDTPISLHSGQVVFITGASGGGKTTLMRCVAEAVISADGPVRLFDFADLGVEHDGPLIDAFPGLSLNDALRVLSLAGLNDAFVMLRRPGELSDGQRYRFRLAQVMSAVESLEVVEPEDHPRAVVLADEFGATLDRLTAKVIARNVRKWVTRTGVCFLAATTHDDLLEPLEPDVLIEQQLGGVMTVSERGPAC